MKRVNWEAEYCRLGCQNTPQLYYCCVSLEPKTLYLCSAQKCWAQDTALVFRTEVLSPRHCTCVPHRSFEPKTLHLCSAQKCWAHDTALVFRTEVLSPRHCTCVPHRSVEPKTLHLCSAQKCCRCIYIKIHSRLELQSLLELLLLYECHSLLI
jgi:hypothetical protein